MLTITRLKSYVTSKSKCIVSFNSTTFTSSVTTKPVEVTAKTAISIHDRPKNTQATNAASICSNGISTPTGPITTPLSQPASTGPITYISSSSVSSSVLLPTPQSNANLSVATISGPKFIAGLSAHAMPLSQITSPIKESCSTVWSSLSSPRIAAQQHGKVSKCVPLMSIKIEPPPGSLFKTFNVQGANDPKLVCIFCDTADHGSHGCVKYSTSDNFWKHVYKNRLCKNCLRPHHKADSCFDQSFCRCSRSDKHSPVLCRQRFFQYNHRPKPKFYFTKVASYPQVRYSKNYFEKSSLSQGEHPKNSAQKEYFTQGTQTDMEFSKHTAFTQTDNISISTQTATSIASISSSCTDTSSTLTESYPSPVKSEGSLVSTLLPIDNSITDPETCTIGTTFIETEPLTQSLVHLDSSIDLSVTSSILTPIDDCNTSLAPESASIEIHNHESNPMTDQIMSLLTMVSSGLSNKSIDVYDPLVSSTLESLTKWLDITENMSNQQDFYSVQVAIKSFKKLVGSLFPSGPSDSKDLYS